MQSFVSNKGFKSGWRQTPPPPPHSLNMVKGGSKQFSIFHSSWTLWKAYSFVVKDYCYLLIADVVITLQFINSLCSHWHFGCHGNLAGSQIHPIPSIQLHFTQKVVGKLPFLLHQNCLHVKEHFLRKFKKILSRGFGATLIFCNIKVAPKPLDFLNFLKKCSLTRQTILMQ